MSARELHTGWRLPSAAYSIVAISSAGLLSGQGGPKPATITFAEHVAPIFFHNCTACHRPTAIGPFPLTNYRETRRRGKMIKRVSAEPFMPPWHTVPGHGEFEDCRRTSGTFDTNGDGEISKRELSDAREKYSNQDG